MVPAFAITDAEAPLDVCPAGPLPYHTCSWTSIQVQAVDLPFQALAAANPVSDLPTITGIADLPPYIAEVVQPVATGVQTSREFANVRGIPSGNASERIRPVLRVGWIVPVEGAVSAPTGNLCGLARSSASR